MKKISLIILFVLLILIGLLSLIYLLKGNIGAQQDNDASVDAQIEGNVLVVGDTVSTWPTIETDSQPIEFTFIDSSTNETIPNEVVSVVVDNGAHSDITIFETITNQTGLAYINFMQWPTFSYGHIKLRNWNCDGKITSYQSDKNLYFTEDTAELSIACTKDKPL